MPKKREHPSYHESLLHWIWDMQEFELTGLLTDSGDSLTIEDPGVLNHGDGPDFLCARFKIGAMIWHGDVELHIKENDWFIHNHHKDPNFNSVILHVYLRRSLRPAETNDGFNPHGLNLTACLKKQMYQLLIRKQQQKSIPCAGTIRPVDPEIFQKQLDRAHKEYLEFKVDELILEYPAGLPVSAAWKQALIVKMYETLGISKNRLPMKNLALQMARLDPKPADYRHFIKTAGELAGLHLKYKWKHNGIRPASYPEIRIRQAAAFHATLESIGFGEFIHQASGLWDYWVSLVKHEDRPGTQMVQILYSTVFLPALFLAGQLLDSRKLKEDALENWSGLKTRLPVAVIEPFREAGIPVQRYNKPGLAHQLKRYCKKRNCHRCELFKNAIHS